MPYSATIVQAAEETKARTIKRDPNNRAESPDYESAAYREQLPDVNLVRDVYDGTKAMRGAGGDEEGAVSPYLPKHPMESPKKYNERRGIALSYNATRRTAHGCVGMVFRRSPTYVDVPTEIEADLEDVDLQGHALPVFLRGVAENAMVDGHTWLHIEEPKVDQERIRTAKQAEDAGVRPYWVNVTKRQAHNWRYEMRNGSPVLTLFCYRESHMEPDGEFGEKMSQRIRVLREGEITGDGIRGDVRGELWEFVEDENKNQSWERIDDYTVGVRRVPVVCVYGDREGVFTSRPPLLDLAYEQIEHFRVRSERQKALTYSAIAVPYAFGKDMTDADGNASVKWGSDGMMLSNDPEAKAGMIESRGHGLPELKGELQEIQARMASLGLQLIARSNQAQARSDQRTATSDVLSKSEGDAWLATFAVSLEDATNEALLIHGEYKSVENPGTVEINRDFYDQLIDAALMRELREFHAAEIIPIEDVWAALQRGEILDESFDFEDARRRLELAREERLAGLSAEMFGGAPPGGDESDDIEDVAA